MELAADLPRACWHRSTVHTAEPTWRSATALAVMLAWHGRAVDAMLVVSAAVGPSVSLVVDPEGLRPSGHTDGGGRGLTSYAVLRALVSSRKQSAAVLA